MRFRLLAAGLVAAFFAAPVPAVAQVIHGKLVADGLNTPIEGATVTLLDARGNELDRIVLTNKNGAFFMRVSSGRYMLRVRRIGYNPLTTPLITLAENDVFEGTYRVSPVAVRLATERITARPNLEWGRDGWSRRKALGQGVFLARADLASKDQTNVSWLFRGVPGIEVLGDGQVRSLEGWRCLYFVMNGVPVPFVPHSFPGESMYPTLHDLVPTGDEVMGIEVYREFQEVPEEFRMDAWPDPEVRDRNAPRTARVRLPLGAQPRAKQSNPPCGLVAVWTRAAW
jgi:hypothetical protein